eukprot:622622-Pyramimonas_sp.AAC.1
MKTSYRIFSPYVHCNYRAFTVYSPYVHIVFATFSAALAIVGSFVRTVRVPLIAAVFNCRVPILAASMPTTVAAHPGDFGAFDSRRP